MDKRPGSGEPDAMVTKTRVQMLVVG